MVRNLQDRDVDREAELKELRTLHERTLRGMKGLK